MANGEPHHPRSCFVCERAFGPFDSPAETWAHGDLCIYICRQCVLDPPRGGPTPLESLPPELRGPRLLHLRSRKLIEQSRGIDNVTAQLIDNSASVRAWLKWLRSVYNSRGKQPESEPPK